ncbi:MAG: winged helix-turn-helix transcriptional regulator [Rhodobacteraceae bacterium]|nr:winged helix-turn-helix transcriptional regulator [Paracoccaceae bacterium]
MVNKRTSQGASASDGTDVNMGKLPGYIGYQVRQTQAAVFRDFSSTGSDLGVSPGEFSLLTLVKENPGIHQKTLAQVHGLDKSTLSNAISDLKRRKLVRGVRDRTDRRFHGLWLTDFGQAVLARVTERIEAQERRMDLVLAPDERDLLLDLLRRLTAALS